MYTEMIKAYLACIFIGYTVAHNCPNVAVQHNFDINKFTGKWYEIEYFDNKIQGNCVMIEFFINADGSVDAERKEILTASNQYRSEKDCGIQVDNHKAKMKVTKSDGTVRHFLVLATDYESFSVIWRCENGIQSAGLLARERQLAPNVLKKAYAAFEAVGISRRYLKIIDQKNCN